jgi:hypothetical protein
MATFSRKMMAAIAVMALAAAWVSAANAELPALIPREVLLGNPVRTSPTISPDGNQLAWLQPDPRGVLQVWVVAIGKNKARMVSADCHRGIHSYRWAYDSRTILYNQDSDGDENAHL